MDLAALDRAHLWHPFTQQQGWVEEEPLIVESAEGTDLIDVHGRRYIDGASSLWCNVHGHRHPRIDAAVREQLDSVAHSTMLGLTHRPAIELAGRLVELAPPGLTRVFYSDSGSTAAEIALKMAFQYWRQRGEDRRRFVALRMAYHGSTLGALSATGQAMRRTGYEPLAPGFLHVAPPDPYRDGIAEDDLDAYGRRCAADLERTIEFELPETIAAVIMEPIITGGGILIPPDSYLPAVRELCDRHGVLLIVDEVICGFGRVGKMFGHDDTGVRPDVVTMAKGITSAYVPLAATVVDEEIFAAFPSDPADAGRLRHINTFGGHPAGCAVALETLAIMEEEGLVERSRTLGASLLARLREALGEHPLVGDVRGRGLLIGIELVADRATRAPAPRAVSAGLVAAAQGRGLLVGRNVDTASGLDDVIALAPPLSMTAADADHIVETLGACFAERTEGVHA